VPKPGHRKQWQPQQLPDSTAKLDDICFCCI
jgi:hypothetical protein